VHALSRTSRLEERRRVFFERRRLEGSKFSSIQGRTKILPLHLCRLAAGFRTWTIPVGLAATKRLSVMPREPRAPGVRSSSSADAAYSSSRVRSARGFNAHVLASRVSRASSRVFGCTYITRARARARVCTRTRSTANRIPRFVLSPLHSPLYCRVAAVAAGLRAD